MERSEILPIVSLSYGYCLCRQSLVLPCPNVNLQTQHVMGGPSGVARNVVSTPCCGKVRLRPAHAGRNELAVGAGFAPSGPGCSRWVAPFNSLTIIRSCATTNVASQLLVRSAGVEPATSSSASLRSIQLSYERAPNTLTTPAARLASKLEFEHTSQTVSQVFCFAL